MSTDDLVELIRQANHHREYAIALLTEPALAGEVQGAIAHALVAIASELKIKRVGL